MPGKLIIGFVRNRVAGTVEVELGRNEIPAELGCPEYAHGFPFCRATVAPAARGYQDVLGWVQLVDSTDLFGEFRIDPFEPLGEVAHPFCFYGFAPVLFDAPHRDHRLDTDWVAHSFLCGLGADPLDGESEVDAILGFSWGFSIRAGEIEAQGPTVLAPEAWDSHTAYLRGAFPAWTFLPDFAD